MLILLAVALAATADTPAPALAGGWSVDLSTKPGEVYRKPMHLELKPDGTVSGDFYDSTIEAGRWKNDRGRVCASFRTTDGVGPYHSAVCLDGDIARGRTWAEHRKFLFSWNATRAPAR